MPLIVIPGLSLLNISQLLLTRRISVSKHTLHHRVTPLLVKFHKLSQHFHLLESVSSPALCLCLVVGNVTLATHISLCHLRLLLVHHRE